MTKPIHLWLGSTEWLAIQRDTTRKATQNWYALRPEQIEPGTLTQELCSYSFFSEPRSIAIDEADSLTEEILSELKDALGQLAPDIQLHIFVAEGKAQKAICELLEANADVQKHEEPKQSGQTWKQMAHEHGLILTPDVQELIQLAYGDHLLQLSQEFEKLSLLDDRKIDIETWRDVANTPGVVDGWQFARAVIAQATDQVNAAIQNWKSLGGERYTAGRDLLGAMAYVLRQHVTYQLLCAQKISPQQAARQTPGRFSGQDQTLSRNWSLAKLSNALTGLMELDYQLKSSSLPAEAQIFGWYNSLILA